MNIKDSMQDMICDYIDGFKISENLHLTLQQIGLDSLDRMELCYYVGEKFDLKERMQDNMTMGEIVEKLESSIGDKKIENI